MQNRRRQNPKSIVYSIHIVLNWGVSMRIISEDFSLTNINITLLVFLIAMLCIVITMKVNKKARYASFLVYASYMVCSILITAVFLTFTWYLAILIGILLSDLSSQWVKKQLQLAREDEQKGGYGLTKQIREQQKEAFILHAAPLDLKKAAYFEQHPVKYNRPLFMTVVNGIGLLIAVAVIVV